MSTTRKVAIGLGIAGGALLAAWLLTGDRKKKTKDFVLRRADDLKKSFQKKDNATTDDHEPTYV
ncbi:MAG: hypothetical protein JST14_13560 [Bacteroidetes bacterium]|nr:hypothetical protein [Bacteroidota bacterium]MBS1976641.1 hypothetical protein [Bacteroidota bacterium]